MSNAQTNIGPFQSEEILKILKNATRKGAPYNRAWSDKVDSYAEYYADLIDQAIGTPEQNWTIEKAAEYTIDIFHPCDRGWSLSVARKASARIIRIVESGEPKNLGEARLRSMVTDMIEEASRYPVYDERFESVVNRLIDTVRNSPVEEVHKNIVGTIIKSFLRSFFKKR